MLMISLRNFYKTFFYSICLLIVFTGCGSEDQTDSADTGTIYISADESFKPVIDSQIQVYEARHPGTKIIPLYKPEAACIKDLMVDSIRLVIITRKYSEAEENTIVDSFKVAPKFMIVARDAVAVIVNPKAPDSLFTMDELKDVLQGRFKNNLIPVFDATRATSTVRFIIDSILHGDSLTPKARAANNSEGVIDYVSKTPDAIGFVGVSWVGNHEDTMQMSFLKKVKIAQLESVDTKGSYVLPVQANIYYRRYPMVRDVISIVKEQNPGGLGHSFASFLSNETGQKIFWRSYLIPALQSFNRRPVSSEE
jgi:phosphate transport system substrate-binding protein